MSFSYDTPFSPKNFLNARLPVKTLHAQKRDFENHFRQKIENSKWLGQIFDYCDSDLSIPFEAFPYHWEMKKSRIKIEQVGLPIQENKDTFGEAKAPNYVVSIPFHNPDSNKVQQIIRSIEDQSFGQNASSSQKAVTTRVAIVMGLNTFKSYESIQNNKFKKDIDKLRNISKTQSISKYVSLTIIPFFWGHAWVPKADTHRYIFVMGDCYRLAKSYFKTLAQSDYPLWISDQFKSNGRPLEPTIPYQLIRNTILHAPSLHAYFKSSQSTKKYVLSLDGDFSSLKSTNNPQGLLSHYDSLIQTYFEKNQVYPDVVSTGYEAPLNDINDMIKKGVELDRLIRASMPAKFVYMPEPNFIFRINDIHDLVQKKLTWAGKEQQMTTESRRLITSGIENGLFLHFVYSNQGGIQTEIDSAWHTATVNKYQKLSYKNFKTKAVQKALRGIHQTHADPQVWATNVYMGLNRSLSSYMSEGIKPIKGIRELFDPISMKNVRYPSKQADELEQIFMIFETYIKIMKKNSNPKQAIESFLDKANITTSERTNWSNFLMTQINNFRDFKNTLKANYSSEEIEDIIEAAIKTGQAIKEFYKFNMEIIPGA